LVRGPGCVSSPSQDFFFFFECGSDPCSSFIPWFSLVVSVWGRRLATAFVCCLHDETVFSSSPRKRGAASAFPALDERMIPSSRPTLFSVSLLIHLFFCLAAFPELLHPLSPHRRFRSSRDGQCCFFLPPMLFSDFTFLDQAFLPPPALTPFLCLH